MYLRTFVMNGMRRVAACSETFFLDGNPVRGEPQDPLAVSLELKMGADLFERLLISSLRFRGSLASPFRRFAESEAHELRYECTGCPTLCAGPGGVPHRSGPFPAYSSASTAPSQEKSRPRFYWSAITGFLDRNAALLQQTTPPPPCLLGRESFLVSCHRDERSDRTSICGL